MPLRIPEEKIPRSAEEDLCLREEFEKYAAAWRKETRVLSSIQAKIFNPNYQKIIGMGPSVLPYVLADLRDNGGQWYWALECIAHDNPAAGAASITEAKQLWLNYGNANGLI